MKKIPLLFAILLLASQLSHAQSVTLATTTVNPTKGTVVYNNTTNQLQYWNGSAWIPVTNAAAGTGWALSGTNVYKSNSGNVGIGITNPANMLQIGSVGSTGFAGNDLAIGDGTSALGVSVSGSGTQIASTTDIFLRPKYNTGNGNIGINVNYAENTLQIGSTLSTYIYGYDFAIGKGSAGAGFLQSGSEFSIASSNNMILLPGYGAGFVGINTSSPRAPLDVASFLNINSIPYAYFYRDGGSGNHVIGSTNSSNASVSIYTTGGVISYVFYSHSDARIKNIVGISNSAKDLETIKALQITDYTMKDQIQNGNKPFKKVIAQQVEKIYPQAVNKVTDVVPDIYVLAENVDYNEVSKTLKCSLATKHDIKVGEKIEFIHATAGKLKAEVIEVSGNNSFTVKDWQHPTDKIFVYGREVNDFRSVDYEAISMLGISAIQQLAKENEELKMKNNEFSRRFEQLSARLETLEAQLPKPPTGK